MIDKKTIKAIALAKQTEFDLITQKEDAFFRFEKSFNNQELFSRITFYKYHIRELTEALALAEKQEALLIEDRQK